MNDAARLPYAPRHRTPLRGLIVAAACLLLAPTPRATAEDRVAPPAPASAEAAQVESLAAAVQAHILLARHDTLGAMAAAYRGLPEFKGAGWPEVAATRQALLTAYAASHLVAAYDREASAAVLSRDGRRIAMGLKDGVEVKSLDPDARLAFLRFPAPPPGSDDTWNQLSSLDISADGRHVLAASLQGYWVWRLDGSDAPLAGSCGEIANLEIARFIGRGDHVLVKCASDLKILATSDLHQVLALADVGGYDTSPDGRLLATDKDVRTIGDGKVVLTFAPGDDRAGLVAFAPDGRGIALARYNTITIWNVAGGAANTAPQLTIEVQSPVAVSWLAYSPDGKVLVTLNSGEIRLWDTESGELSAVWSDNRINLSAETPGVDRAYVSADGRWLLTASNWQDGMYTAQSTMWSLWRREAQPIRIIRGAAELLPSAFVHGAARFATIEKVSARGRVFVWSANSSLLLHRWAGDDAGSAAPYSAAAASNDIIVKKSEDGPLMRCRFDTFACEAAPASALEALDTVVATPGGKARLSLQGQTLVATSLKDGTIVWRRSLGAMPGDYKVFAGGAYVRWTAGMGGEHPTLIVLRGADGVPARIFTDASSVTPLSGPLVVVAQRPKGFALVNLDTGRTTPLDLPGEVVGAAAVTRDGARAAVVTALDQSTGPARPGTFLSIVTAATGHVDHTGHLEVAEGYSVNTVEFSPDGKAILAGDQIIDATSGRRIAVLAANTDVPVHSSQYSPDGRLIFAFYDAGLAHSTSLRIYSAHDGMLLQTYLTPVSFWLQFSQDGNAFALQDFDGLAIHLMPNSDAISARVRRLLDSAGLLAPP